MHDDDGTQRPTTDPAVVVVPCDGDGTCDRSELAALLGADGAEWVWLVVDGRGPGTAPAGARSDRIAWVTLHPMTDAVKRVDDHDVVVDTVDRSTLRIVRPPALLPRRVVVAALERVDRGRCRPLHEALDLGLELRPLPDA